jgi:hypothetical protein
MNRRKLLTRLAGRAFNNVAFTDIHSLVESFGFEMFERYNLPMEDEP